jgi:hypothetical protein
MQRFAAWKRKLEKDHEIGKVSLRETGVYESNIKHVAMLHGIRLEQEFGVVVFVLDRGRKCMPSNRRKDE